MKQLKWLFYIWVSIFLTGCPVPNPYKIFVNQKPGNIISSELYYNQLLSAYPWLDTKKKIITIISSVRNLGSQSININLDSANLSSKKEFYRLIKESKNLKNPFKVESINLIVKPNESLVFSLYFMGNQEYSKNEYKQSLERDTLILYLKVLNKPDTFYLIQ